MTYSAKQRSSFGQRVRGYSTRRAESSGGGGGFALSTRWHNRVKPPQNVTNKYRLLPGAYMGFEGEENEYFPYVEHFVARSNRGFICSKQYQIVDGELTTVGGKCLGCQERDNGAEDISWRMMHAFNVIHLAWYHLEPVFDDSGKPILYKKGDRKGDQIHRKVLCEGRRCPHCKEGLEKVFGKKGHWSIGSGHLNDLGGFVTEIEKDCVNCGEGRLEEVSYECAKCGHPLIDIAECDLDHDGIAKYVARKQECPECGKRDYLIRQVECDQCQDPTPLSVFDCTLEIKRQGEGTNSTVQIPRWTVEDLPKELEEMAKPYNFKKVFAPDPFEWQAKVLKIRNPYGKDDPQDHSKEYGKEDGDAADADYGD
jgi:DNA-directed RNA polymerase subunit RPC12/RpoP